VHRVYVYILKADCRLWCPNCNFIYIQCSIWIWWTEQRNIFD